MKNDIDITLSQLLHNITFKQLITIKDHKGFKLSGYAQDFFKDDEHNVDLSRIVDSIETNGSWIVIY